LIERISRRFVEQNESCLIEVWLALFSALSSRHRYFVVAVIVQISTLGVGCAKRQPGQPVNSLSPAQANSEIRRLNKEIEKLRNSSDAPEGWKELQTAQAKIEELRFRTFELSQSPQVYQWQQRIDKLQQELDEIAAADHRLTVDDGARLFHARHAELSKQLPNTPKLHGLGFNVLNYPRIDGSTSTQPLAVLITCSCFGVPSAWVGRGQYRPKPPLVGLEAVFGLNPEPEAELLEFTLEAKAGGASSERLAAIINQLLATNASTNQAYINLIEGRSDIGLLARPPSSAELDLARAKSVDLEILPCALDAFVFLVNNVNPVRNLTSKQIQDIYSRKITGWESVGGFGAITAYQREENSGSQQLMNQLVMKDVPLYNPKEYVYGPQLVGQIMSSTFLSLTNDENGIGYSVYYYEHFMSGSPRTRIIAVDGIEPNPETIGQRKYPYVSEVFVVTRKGLGNDAPAAKLRAWLLSPEGQSVVRASGYVPLLATIEK
jgi:ABC-type phosphate transport system substrate-binding protein